MTLDALARIARRVGIRTRRQFRLALRGVAVIVITLCGYALAVMLEMKLFTLSAVPLVILAAATMFEFVLSDRIAERSYPFETEKILDLLERQLGRRAVESITEKLERIIGSFQACDHKRISGTVHVLVNLDPTPEGETRVGLLQLTDYIGPASGSKGRITTLDQGVIGRCARTGKPEYVNFADYAEYQERMVEEFGFSDEEAKRHTKIARSYVTEPLVLSRQLDNTEEVVGVLYFFSAEPQVFPHAARQTDLTSQAKDIVQLLKTTAIVSVSRP
jgi:hypothetical protein